MTNKKIRQINRDALLALGLEGKAIVHPCCNSGRDLISIKYLGANRCFGFDASDASIEYGKQLAITAEVEIELIQSDIYEIPADYSEQFDIAYISAGTLRCYPDILTFFDSVKKLIKKGGYLYIQEIHPILDMFGMESTIKPRKMKNSYFKKEVPVSIKGLDYLRYETYRSKPSIRYHHKVSDIIEAVVNSNLLLKKFDEQDENISAGTFEKLQKSDASLPLSYILIAQRPVS
jgi:ubiquinone/menaquinone biosynthesis C-methylase UbiE